MAQRTLQVENRILNGEAIAASGRTHCDIIAAAVSDAVEVLSKDDIAKIVMALCSKLELTGNRLGAAEDRNVAEQADDVVLRAARDGGLEKVLRLYVRARGRVDGALGEAGLARYGLDGPTPRTPDALASRVENTINLMRSDPTELDDELSDPVSTTVFADRLAAALAPLSAALASLRTEDREDEAALTDRDRALDEWSLVYQSVAAILSGLYRLAGREDLAERIRPTERRASGLDGPPPDVAPAAPASGTPSASDPTAT